MKFLADLERLDAAVAKGPVVARHGDDYADVVAGPQRVAYVWSKPERELYVLLRNACPSLVALVRAAGAMASVLDQTPVYGTNDIAADYVGKRENAQRALRAALSALGGAK